MRLLLPRPAESVDPLEVYGPLPRRRSDRPWVLSNFVSSADGAVAVDGRSGGLGGPADRLVFRLLRSLADVILVGAQTVRVEGYGPARIRPDHADARTDRGQAPTPAIAVVSSTLQLDWSSPLFTEAPADARTIVICGGGSDPDARSRAAEVADVVVAGDGPRADLATALGELGRLGHHVVLTEGGPVLQGTLTAAGLVDELCLTIAPTLVGGGPPRLLDAMALEAPVPLHLTHLLEADDGFLFARYLVASPPAGDEVAGDGNAGGAADPG